VDYVTIQIFFFAVAGGMILPPRLDLLDGPIANLVGTVEDQPSYDDPIRDGCQDKLLFVVL